MTVPTCFGLLISGIPQGNYLVRTMSFNQNLVVWCNRELHETALMYRRSLRRKFLRQLSRLL